MQKSSLAWSAYPLRCCSGGVRSISQLRRRTPRTARATTGALSSSPLTASFVSSSSMGNAYTARMLFFRSRQNISLLHMRCYSTAPSHGFENREGDDEDDFLQAYEELLLNASAQSAEEMMEEEKERKLSSSSADVDTTKWQPRSSKDAAESFFSDGESVTADVSTPLAGAASRTSAAFPVDDLLQDALSLLPADGSPVPLTAVTPSLDLEVISEHFGSAKNFFQLFPHHFTCAQEEQTKRWKVGRAAPRAGAPALLSSTPTSVEAARLADLSPLDNVNNAAVQHAALDVAELALDEELTLLRVRTSPAARKPDNEKKSETASGKERMLPTRHPCLVSTSNTGAAVAPLGGEPSIPTLDTTTWWPTIAALLPEDGRALPIAQLRAQLPPAIVRELHDHHCGLARCFKQHYDVAQKSLLLSSDSASLMRASCTPSPLFSVWTPPSPAPAAISRISYAEMRGQRREREEEEEEAVVYVPVPEEYRSMFPSANADAWWAEVPLDDADAEGDEVEGEEGGGVSPEKLSDGPLTTTGLEEVPYDGLGTDADVDAAHRRESAEDAATVLSGLNVERLRNAPAISLRKKPSPSLPAPTNAPTSTDDTAEQPQQQQTPQRKPRQRRPSTPEEWMALHAAMATARGWLTPAQMLDYLVECVPTFFVPLDEVRISDSLLTLVGPRTTMRALLCRIYTYYVERSEDKTRVRLAPTVRHPQRGAADVHYEQWKPAAEWVPGDSGSWGIDAVEGEEKPEKDRDTTSAVSVDERKKTDAVEARVKSPAPSLLKSSSTTKSFPVLHVLRPIRSKLPGNVKRTPLHASESPAAFSAVMAHAGERPRKKKRGSTANDGSGAEVNDREGGDVGSSADATIVRSPAMLLSLKTVDKRNPNSGRSGAARVPLSAIPVSDIGYPYLALATQPAMEWPWWAQLLCVLPFDRYTPLDEVNARCTRCLTPSEVELMWRASSSSVTDLQPGKPVPSHPFPYTLLRTPPDTKRQVRLRPFWLAPGCTAELDAEVLPANFATQLRPVWMPVARVLKKLPDDGQREVFAFALRRMPGVTVDPETALTCLLRDCGRCCWVTEAGTKVRRYAASREMDDMFHVGLSLLYGFSSAHAWEPLTEVLGRAAQHVQPLFDSQGREKSTVETPWDVGLIGMFHHTPQPALRAFLERHVLWLDVKMSADGAGSALWIRRRAALVSFKIGAK